ncbi:MAG: hypothetical protein RL207_1944 [Bacteroidota bacterium]
MKPFRFVTLLFGLVIFIFASCSSNTYEVNVDEVPLNIDFVNLDSLAFHANWSQRDALFMNLKKKDEELFNFAFSFALEIPLTSDTAFRNGINRFYGNPYIFALEKKLATKAKWRKESSNLLLNGFKRLAFFMPNWKKPNSIYFINSRFAASAYCTDKSIAIGQERYLGPSDKLIQELPSNQFYGWIKEAMQANYVGSDALLVWISSHGIEETSENYASEMIRWGKMLFLTHICLPELPESDILRYSKKDYNWAIASEKSFWEYLVDEELLFKTDEETRMNFLHEGPFTTGLPQESPDRMGRFMGYMIVKQYMENNDVSPKELMLIPYNKILQKYQVN